MRNSQHDFNTAQELVDFFQKKPMFCTKNIWQVNSLGRGDYIYRGQSDANWKLEPSVFRSSNLLEDYTPQVAGQYNSSSKNKQEWLGWQLHAELRAVFIFIENADKLGVATAIDYTKAQDHKRLIESSLKNNSPDFSEIFPNIKASEDFALAQHHGIPTRLLDWTESPLIACFFAAQGASSVAPESERVKSKKISISCLRTDSFRTSDTIVNISAPRHMNNFMRVQQGLFTNIAKANEYFINNERWPSIEDVVEENKELNGALKKYTIPTAEADNMLRILFDYGINKHQMMPTLDNIANSFKYASALFKNS